MEDSELLDQLQRLLRRLNEMPDTREPELTAVGRVIADHLGEDPTELGVTTETFPAARLVDVDVALEHISAGDPDGQLFGVRGGLERQHEEFGALIRHRYSGFAVGAPDTAASPIGPEQTRRTVTFGIRLFRYDGVPFAVLQRAALPAHGRGEATIEIIAAGPHDDDGSSVSRPVAAFIADVRRRMNELSVIRGNVVSFTPDPYGNGIGGMTFLARRPVPADAVVLPDGVLQSVRDHVLGIGEHAEALVASGQHLKRGVLLYGPPGTGKTLTVEHLIAEGPDRTVILLQGGALAFVADAARLARAMAPAMLVFEDVDLVATERGVYGVQPLLFEILDALDGVGPDADIAFVMTTNRADVLEPALAQRPGRVDLAAEVPLPDEAARRRLFALYARDLPLSADVIDEVAHAADGVTASFAKELVRRAVLRATLDGRPVTDDDLRVAYAQLAAGAAALTRSLLGASE